MKFHSKPVAEHAEVPLADAGHLEAVVSHWTRRESPERPATGARNRCFVLSLSLPKQRNDLAEILGLVEAQGDEVVGHEEHRLTRPDPRTLLGSGVAERIGTQARNVGADLLVVDAHLTPSQTRNLEDVAGIPVCDREAVILNVFQRHAKTNRARVQVEIAHLEYLRPRIRGIGLNMDQQAGGRVKARGPGETASELLARRLDDRLVELRRALERVKDSDRVQRRQRSRAHRIVLVGYTNAGKTSLMNALTSATLSVRDRPFETLDTTSRCLTRHGGDVLLSDTVGFIRRMPERLFASFESTLAEVREASLLALVVDVSDPELPLKVTTTREMLARLGATEIPRLTVFNKLDLLAQAPAASALEVWSDGHPFVALTSRDPVAVAELRETLSSLARAASGTVELFLPYDEPGRISLAYSRCRVLGVVPEEGGLRFRLEASPEVLAQISGSGRSGR